MEAIVSAIIGIVVMEAYVWLDPLSKYLLRRAAKRLPQSHRDEFVDQWEGDLAAVPNSIFKLYFVMRDCVLPIEEIRQTMVREGFADIAERFNDLLVSCNCDLEDLERRWAALVARGKALKSGLPTRLDFVLERMQQRSARDEVAPFVERCLLLKPELLRKADDYEASIEHDCTLLFSAVGALRETLSQAAQVHGRLAERLLDAKPMRPVDSEFLKAVSLEMDAVGTALDDFGRAAENYSPHEVRTNLTAAVDAFKDAVLSASGRRPGK